MGKKAFSASDVKSFMQPHLKSIDDYVKENVKNEDFKGFGKGISAGIQKINSDAGSAATAYGGLAGGVGGIMSDDRDMGFWKGAAMGAYTGRSAATKGISSDALTGAGIGAASSLVTGQSMIGSAFAGATLGGGGLKNVRGFRDSFKAIHNKQVKHRGADAPVARSAKFAGRATYNAMKKDIGQTWRGTSTRRSKNSSNLNSNKSR